MSFAALGGSKMRAAAGEAVELGGTKACQDREVSLGIFVIYLDHAANEEVFLLWCPSFPVIRFSDGDRKTNFAGPPFALSLFFICWNQVHKIIDCAQLLHVPCFPD